MSSEFEQNLKKYAKVIVKVGLNLQPGQRLLIGGLTLSNDGTPLEFAPLVRLIAKEAYQIGARLVDVMWGDDQLRLIRFQHAPKDSFEVFPKWRIDAEVKIGEAGDADLVIVSSDPELLREQDPQLITKFQQTFFKHVKPLSDLISKNAMNWLAASGATDGWANKVFPTFPKKSRKAKLWDSIFEICRVKEKDPISAWRDHIDQLGKRKDYLNSKKYNELKLIAPGTDLTIGLPKGHKWVGGITTTQNGINFTPNMPTEEIFTIPHKDKTEGIVSSTKPLYYGGVIIEDFRLKFSEGRIIEVKAKKGADFLLKTLETDNGARYLGEIALVPHSSPISQSDLLFYNTLIDENAAIHVAFGRARKFNLENGEEMSDDDFAGVGGNLSLIHIDFMIGSGEMDVDGITEDGTFEPIMRNGEWAFKV
ncbi:MAG: aminopeptidase [Promethearchaeota archaeon Loki_b32]|nr:MAG: aminopeptidase [Candidatus Lokiarchaeota archaeon Loki_b32]